MDQRLILHKLLESIMLSSSPNVFPDTKNSSKYHVYFQPDQNVALAYPAIVYEREAVTAKHANNVLYGRHKRYRLTVIDRNPDSPIPDAVLSTIPMTRFVAHLKKDGLNQDSYTTYF